MIWEKETLLRKGKVFKFALHPIDPTDPFRGAYLRLRFTVCDLPVALGGPTKDGTPVFALLKTDKDGFAALETVLEERPDGGEDYVQATLRKHYRGYFTLKFDFDRFYMDRDLAETLGRWGPTPPGGTSYALVRVRNGDAAVEDLVIRGVPLKGTEAKK